MVKRVKAAPDSGLRECDRIEVDTSPDWAWDPDYLARPDRSPSYCGSPTP